LVVPVALIADGTQVTIIRKEMASFFYLLIFLFLLLLHEYEGSAHTGRQWSK